MAAVFCFFLIAFVVQAFRVQGTSMLPLLADGERIVVNKFLYRFSPIGRGDVVVFWYPREPSVSFIKRVVALPGDTVELRHTGWDLGAAVNHAAVIMEKRLITSEDGEKEWPVFCVIDEMFHKSDQLSISDLGLEMLDKMTAIETEYGRKFHWTHYSDDSATSLYRASSGSFDYLEILNATDNAIHLIGVQKPTGSVQARVRLLRRLLRERRFYISSKCTATIDMLMNCKQGSTHRDFVEWNEWKHMFDAITYVLFMECAADLEIVLMRPTARKAVDMSMDLIQPGVVAV